MSDEIQLKREVEATAIPAGTKKRLSQGTAVVVTQDLGGTFTIHATAEGGLFRIEGKDADALGRKVTETGVIDSNKEAGEEDVWGVLKTCYDPEIPVNIVDLGLIYSMELKKTDAGGKRAEVKMTLTAQGTLDRGGCSAKDTFLIGNSGGASGCSVGTALGPANDHSGRSQEVGDGLRACSLFLRLI